MTKIKGKQIADSTIKQNNLNIATDTITYNSAVTNIQYIQTLVDNNIKNLSFAYLNNNMSCLETTSAGQLATANHIIEYPISSVRVKVNGVEINVGGNSAPYDGYFSPDSGTTIRPVGYAEKGDYFYWNALHYNLNTDDDMDFEYLVNYRYYQVDSGITTSFNDKYDNTVIRYKGDVGSTSTVVIDSVNFTVGNVSGNFVFDIGGNQEHTFTYILERITIVVNNKDYDVVWDGFGSLIFSIEKKKTKPTKKLISLIDENIISTHIYNMNYMNNDLYITNDIQSEAYTKELHKYNIVSDTWSKITAPTGYLNQHDYYNMITHNNNIFMSSYYRLDENDNNWTKIIRSTDSGNTWNIVYTNTNPTYNGYLPQILFVNNNIGYGILRTTSINNGYGHNFGLLKTIDGGNNWSLINVSVADGNHTIAYFINENEGWFYGTYMIYNNGYILTERIYHTTDGGLSSTLIYEQSVNNMKYLQFIDSNNGFCLFQDKQTLYNTTDSGISFNSMNINHELTGYTSIYDFKINNNIFYLAIVNSDNEGYNNVSYLLISLDFGNTWIKKIIKNNFNIESLKVIDDNHIFVYGKYSTYYYMPVIFETLDSGNTWLQILNLDAEENFLNYNTIYFIDNQNGFLLGENKTLLKTVDAGANWYSYNIGLGNDNSYYLSNLLFNNLNNGFIVGYKSGTVYSYEPVLLKSIDGGETWSGVTLPIVDGCLEKIYFNSNVGWITGYDNNNVSILLKSIDGGETWINTEFNLTNSYYTDIKFINQSIGFIVGYNYDTSYGFIYRTIDSGVTWIENTHTDYFSYYDLAISNNNIYLSATDDNNGLVILYKSNNNGLTWVDVTPTFEKSGGWISQIEFSDVNNGIFILTYGQNDSILYTTSDGGNTWKILNSSQLNGQYNSISKNYVVGYTIKKTIALYKIA